METCSTCEPWLASLAQPRSPQRSLRKSTTTYITHLSLHTPSYIIKPATHSKELQRPAPTPKPTLQRLQDARTSPNITATCLYGFKDGLIRRKRGTFSISAAHFRQHHRPEHRTLKPTPHPLAKMKFLPARCPAGFFSSSPSLRSFSSTSLASPVP